MSEGLNFNITYHLRYAANLDRETQSGSSRHVLRPSESRRRAGNIQPCDGQDVDLPCNLVYSVLKAMTTFPTENNDRVFEALSNALVRRVLFVTGAVDMSGCPPADRGEAVFIGRSNVGKSSLINMVRNRRHGRTLRVMRSSHSNLFS